MSRPAVSAAGLVQRFGRQVALRGVDLQVEAGERLVILGDNGAGKSTLLRLLATVAQPTSGELKLFGLDALRQRSALRRRIGWLAHQTGLYPALTVLENLEFFCTLHGLSRSRAAECLDLLGVGADAGRPAGQLSRGRQQRLALARSLLHDPELWVLDEPDSSLDAGGRRLLATLAGDRTVVAATHDRDLAAALGARTLTLREGRVLERPALEVVN